MSKKEISDALNEIRFLASIRHKNIVGFLESFLENNETELCIVMEFCGCGDLAQKVERYKRRRTYIDEDVIWRYLIQCLKALEHLHEKGICHRDLKVANTFLAEDGSIKIGDMNVSKRLSKKGQLQTQIGTPYYMSPEIWNNRPYDWSSDMWALGCMMYEVNNEAFNQDRVMKSSQEPNRLTHFTTHSTSLPVFALPLLAIAFLHSSVQLSQVAINQFRTNIPLLFTESSLRCLK